MLTHVTGDLGTEELGGHHQTGLAVPVGQSPLRRPWVECSTRMFVETDCESDVRGARPHGIDGREQRASACCATVLDVRERDAGEAEFGDEGIGETRAVTATERYLYVRPGQIGIAQCVVDRGDGHLTARHSRLPSELGQPCTDDRNILCHWLIPVDSGCMPRVSTANRGTGAVDVRRTGAPSSSSKLSQSRIASILMPSGSFT